MGLFDFVKNQLIEVIEWTDDSQDTLIYRFPVQGKEIKMGAKLTVRESQKAVFINEGVAVDIFEPGLYTLSTQNLPFITKALSLPYGFNSPFKAEVYFINTRQYTDQKWGTSNPIMMRDAELGMLRLRAYGIYSFRVAEPLVFLRQVSGTEGQFTLDGITGQTKRMILSGLTDLLGESKIPALSLAAYYDELSQQTAQKLAPAFGAMGMELCSFFVENISLPAEVEKMLDTRTNMNLVGNIQQYAQFQAANSIQDAAKNPGGFANAGIGLGAGAVLGSAFAQTFVQQPQQQVQQAPVQSVACAECGAKIPQGSKFCTECGKPVPQPGKCSKCGTPLPAGSKFCTECGSAQSGPATCKSCGKPLQPDMKFCHECGSKIE